MKSAAIGIVYNANRTQVLLVKRRDVPIWVLPGGGVDLNETPEQAVIRELQEESGLETTIARKVGEYTPINSLAQNTHLFECTQISGNIQTTSETIEVGFFPINNLPKPFFFIHEEWLRDSLLNNSYFEKQLTSVTYWQFLKYTIKHPIFTGRFLLSRIGFPINSN